MKAEAKFKMVIQTNSHTGSFERAMGGFLFGYSNGTCRDAEEFVEKFEAEFGLDKMDEITDYLEIVYNDHGDAICSVEEPKSNALTFYFSRNPKKIKKFIKERLELFPLALAKLEFGHKGLKIKSVKYYKIETKETEI